MQHQTQQLTGNTVYPPQLYVTQSLLYQQGNEQIIYDDAYATVRAWLDEPRSQFMLILGEFGTGKTFLLRELARRMGEENTALIPIFLDLRRLEKSHQVDMLLAQQLAAQKMAFDPEKFRYMLDQGKVALLFDGYDELALRVTYDKAVEHFDTLLNAAQGEYAKILVTSRSQHFISDRQVKERLWDRAESINSRRIVFLQRFERQQIAEFLQKKIGDEQQAAERLALIEEVHDLMGLSSNPRMLSFIAELPEADLRAAQAREGNITAADLYRTLLGTWLDGEDARAKQGFKDEIKVEQRWQAVTQLALALWEQTDATINVEAMTETVRNSLALLLDVHIATQQIGSGTLLIRDAEGQFGFIHQSVMEWLLADAAAQQAQSWDSQQACQATLLACRELSPLMADFFKDLAGCEAAQRWAIAVIGDAQAIETAKKNALLLWQRLPDSQRGQHRLQHVQLAGFNLSGQNFSGQDLAHADFRGANLSQARFSHAQLSQANFHGAHLFRTDFLHADLSHADLSHCHAFGARFSGANLQAADLSATCLHAAKLLGAQLQHTQLPQVEQFEPALTPADPLFGAVLKLPSLPLSLSLNHDLGTITCVAYSPDGRWLACGSFDHTLRLWAVDSGQALRSFSGHQDWVNSVAFSPDGTRLVSGSSDQTLRLWAVDSGQMLRTFSGHQNRVNSVAFSPDGTRLVSGSFDETLRLWAVDSGQVLRTFSGHQDSVLSVAFSPDGTRLVSGSSDQTLRLWAVDSGQVLRTFSGHQGRVNSVAFSPDGARLVSGSSDQTLRLWAVDSGQALRTFSGHQSWVFSVAFSPDGARLVSGSNDKTLRLWAVDSGQALRTFSGHQWSVSSVAFSPDGARLVSGSYDQTLRLWAVDSGQVLHTFSGHQGSVSSVAFSPDGTRLVSGSRDKTLRLWAVDSGWALHTFSGHQGGVLSVAFSPDGARLASGSDDKTLRLWAVDSGQVLRTFSGHQGGINSVAFSPDETRLVSGSEDKTLRLWAVDSGHDAHADFPLDSGVASYSRCCPIQTVVGQVLCEPPLTCAHIVWQDPPFA